jgi:glycosyltransferase involved in cell wall biosynthesis
MRIVIAATYFPFEDNGDTRIVNDLHRELRARGFETDRVMLPFKPEWSSVPEQTLGLRLLDLTESSGVPIDLLITIRTPAHALRHPNKVAWFIDHHREGYDPLGAPLSGIPDDDTGRQYRDMTRKSDGLYLRECRKVFAKSRAAADRLRKFNDLEPDGILYRPLPSSASFREGPFGDYLFYQSRVAPINRQELALEAMKHTRPDVRLVIGGTDDMDSNWNELRRRAQETGVDDRIEFTGRLSEERKAELTAGCCGALYLANGEDSYDDVTLEALLSGKPIVTLRDCGGASEVIEDGVNGLIAEPEARALAEAMNRLWVDRPAARKMGGRARKTPGQYRIHWDNVVESLTS